MRTGRRPGRRTPTRRGCRHDAVRRRCQRGDVFGGVARRGHQPDRRAQRITVGFPADPEVAVVDRPVVMDPGRREQGCVDGVIGMVVAEHHVGHDLRRHPLRGELGQQSLPRGDHTRIDDDGDAAVLNQRDGAADVLAVGGFAGVPRRKHVHGRGPGQREVSLWHAQTLSAGRQAHQQQRRCCSGQRRHWCDGARGCGQDEVPD